MEVGVEVVEVVAVEEVDDGEVVAVDAVGEYIFLIYF